VFIPSILNLLARSETMIKIASHDLENAYERARGLSLEKRVESGFGRFGKGFHEEEKRA